MNRTAFLTASATLVAASTGAAPAQSSIPGGSSFVERKANFAADEFARIVGRPAQIREVCETVVFRPGILDNIKNALNGLQFGFGYPAEAIAIALAGHGPSASYGYSDYVWQKYRIGAFFKLTDASGASIASNVFLPRKAAVNLQANPDDPNGMYQDMSIEMLQQRGVIMLTCHTAVEEQSRQLVKQGFAPAGATATQVADDILTHLVPGAVVVPSMVAALAVLQATFHYTYISPEL